MFTAIQSPCEAHQSSLCAFGLRSGLSVSSGMALASVRGYVIKKESFLVCVQKHDEYLI